MLKAPGAAPSRRRTGRCRATTLAHVTSLLAVVVGCTWLDTAVVTCGATRAGPHESHAPRSQAWHRRRAATPTFAAARAADDRRHRAEAHARSQTHRDNVLSALHRGSERAVRANHRAAVHVQHDEWWPSPSPTPAPHRSTQSTLTTADACPYPVPHAGDPAVYKQREWYLGELTALLQLYESLHGHAWTYPTSEGPVWFDRGDSGLSWSYCCWRSVACQWVRFDARPYNNATDLKILAVASIVLDAVHGPLGVQGTIPSTVLELQVLQQLAIAGYPGIVGPLPTPTSSQVVDLSLLEVYNVSVLAGVQPWPLEDACALFEIETLRTVKLAGTGIVGTVPTCMSSQSGVRYLNLDNSAINGSLPTTMCAMRDIGQLYLRGNSLTAIPGCIATLPHLEVLVASDNDLGELRDDMFGSPTLQYFALDTNPRMAGTISERVATMTSLHYFGLSETLVHGSIPDSLWRTPVEIVTLFVDGHYAKAEPGVSPLGLVGGISEALALANASLHTLDLGGQINMGGTVPRALGQLPMLKFISLHHMSMSGTLPGGTGQRGYYNNFDFSHNRITGEFHELPFWPVVKAANNVILSDNLFTGHLPALDEYPELLGLDAGYNQLNRTIPATLFAAPELMSVRLSFNRLTGTLSEALVRDATLVDTVVLEYNDLEGTLPSGMWQAPRLREVTIGGNPRLTGGVGAMPPNATHLRTVKLNDCNFTGQLPAALFTLVNMSWIEASGNPHLTVGQRPASPPRNLETLKIAGPTTLRGTLPAAYMASGAMIRLNVSGSGVAGEVGAFAPGSTCNIERVDVSHNRLLGGTMPQSTGACDQLTLWDSSHTLIGGAVPSWLATAPRLKFFVASSSPLRGPLPGAFGATSQSLESVFLSGTHVSGQLPASLGDLGNLTQLTAAGTRLTGTIPVSLSRCARLQSLDLGSNPRVHGGVPDLRLATGLQSLRLDGMALGGTVPDYLASLANLTTLWLDLNALSCSYGPSWSEQSSFPAIRAGHACSNDESGAAAACGLAVSSGNMMACPLPDVVSQFDGNSIAESCFDPTPPYLWHAMLLGALLLAGVTVALLVAPSAWSGTGLHAVTEAWALARRPEEWLRSDMPRALQEVAAMVHLQTRTLVWAAMLLTVAAAMFMPINAWAQAPYQCRFDFSVTLFGVRYDLTDGAATGDSWPAWVVGLPAVVSSMAVVAWVLLCGRRARGKVGQAQHSGFGNDSFASRTASTTSAASTTMETELAPTGPSAASSSPLRQPRSGVRRVMSGALNRYRVTRAARSAGETSAALILFAVSLASTVAPTALFVVLWSSSSVVSSVKGLAMLVLAGIKAAVNEVLVPPAAEAAVMFCRRRRTKAHAQDVLLWWSVVLSLVDLLFVPLLLVLLLDRRCLWYFWAGGPRVSDTSYKFLECQTRGSIRVNDVLKSTPCDAYSEHYIRETYEYPVVFSPMCASGVVELVGPLLLQTVVFQATMRPVGWIARALASRVVARPAASGARSATSARPSVPRRLSTAMRRWVHKHWHQSLVDRYSELAATVALMCALGPAYPPLVGAGFGALLSISATQCLLTAGPLVAARNALTLARASTASLAGARSGSQRHQGVTSSLSAGVAAPAVVVPGVRSGGGDHYGGELDAYFDAQHVRGVSRVIAPTLSAAVLLTHAVFFNLGAFSGSVAEWVVPLSAALTVVTLALARAVERRRTKRGRALHSAVSTARGMGSVSSAADVALLSGAADVSGVAGAVATGLGVETGVAAAEVSRRSATPAASGDYMLMA